MSNKRYNIMSAPILEATDNPTGPGLHAACEGALGESHLYQPLNDYVQGLAPTKTRALLDALLPACRVNRMFQARTFGKGEALLSESDDVRAIGSNFKQVTFAGSTFLDETVNKGLTAVLDHDKMAPGEEELIVEMLIERLALNDLMRLWALLDAACTNVASNWTTGSPDKALRDAYKAGSDALGQDLNTCIIGQAAWNARLDYWEGSDAQAAGVKAEYDEGRLASYLGVDQVARVDARHRTKKNGPITDALGRVVYLMYNSATATRMDPATVKRFLTEVEGAGEYGVTREVKGKLLLITVEHYSRIAQCMPGGRKLSITV